MAKFRALFSLGLLQKTHIVLAVVGLSSNKATSHGRGMVVRLKGQPNKKLVEMEGWLDVCPYTQNFYIAMINILILIPIPTYNIPMTKPICIYIMIMYTLHPLSSTSPHRTLFSTISPKKYVQKYKILYIHLMIYIYIYIYIYM